MEEPEGENGDEGLNALDLLKRKADEVFSTFELLPRHLQMDGLDVLQGIVTKTIRKITLGKVSDVKFVPVQERRQKAVTAPSTSEQEVTTSNPEVQGEQEVTRQDVVHFDDDPVEERGAGAQASSSCPKPSVVQSPTITTVPQTPPKAVPTVPSTGAGATGEEITKTTPVAPKGDVDLEQFDLAFPVRSMERRAARAAIAKIKEEVWMEDANQQSLDTSRDMDIPEDMDSDGVTLDLLLDGAQDSEGEKVGDGNKKINSKLKAKKKRKGRNPLKGIKRPRGSLKFRCRWCPYSSDVKEELVSHKASVHSGDRMYECEFCNRKFSATSSLKRHKVRHTGVKEHECPVCGKQFYDQNELKTHSVVHTGERLYQCTKCSKCYTCSANLRRHYRIHTGEMPYKCKECDAHFRDFSSLKLHKLKHTGEKPYTCEVCSKQFKTSSDFRRHERTHTGERKYNCRECGKMFIQGWHLVQHMRVHNNERAWSCQQCGKNFRTKASLQYHTRSHLGIKDYTCMVCNKAFSTKKYLQSHQVVHTLAKPYRCAICGARFNQHANMKRHERIHSDHKPYACKVCGKKFKYINSLQYHEGIHRGVRRICDVCGLGFRSMGGMKRHFCDPTMYNANLLKTATKQKLVISIKRFDLGLLENGIYKVDVSKDTEIAESNKTSNEEVHYPRIVLKIPKKKLKKKTLNVLRMTALRKERVDEVPSAVSEHVLEEADGHEVQPVPAVTPPVKRGRGRPKKVKPTPPSAEKRVPPLRISSASGSPEARPVPVCLFSRQEIADQNTTWQSSSMTLFQPIKTESDDPSYSDSNSRSASDVVARGESPGLSLGLTVLKNPDGEMIVKEELMEEGGVENVAVFATMDSIKDDKTSPDRSQRQAAGKRQTAAEVSDVDLMKAAYF